MWSLARHSVSANCSTSGIGSTTPDKKKYVHNYAIWNKSLVYRSEIFPSKAFPLSQLNKQPQAFSIKKLTFLTGPFFVTTFGTFTIANRRFWRSHAEYMNWIVLRSSTLEHVLCKVEVPWRQFSILWGKSLPIIQSITFLA